MCECGYTNTRGEREDGLVANKTENVVAVTDADSVCAPI